MGIESDQSQAPEQIKNLVDENSDIKNSEPLPINAPLKVLRYKTIKKNNALGWWSAVVLLEDHDKKQICFYRWRKKDKVWKRDKKLPFHSAKEWTSIKEAVDGFMKEVEQPVAQ